MASRESDRRLEPRALGEMITVEFLSPLPRIRDLSTSGLYLLDPHPFRLGETIELRLTLGNSKPMIVRGMVRRIDPGQGMAIEFTHIDNADRRRVKEFIAHSDPKNVSPAGPRDV